MRLYELAYCCRLYEHLTNYDVSLKRVRKVVPGGVDLDQGAHRDAVLKWLREWGCRQFAHEYQDLSSSSLREWASEWVRELPKPQLHLVDLGDQEIERGAEAYDHLRVRPASYSQTGSGKHLKTVGPVGAAKTLYILRPNVFPPWDRAIMRRLRYGQSGPEYRRYLSEVAQQLREVSRDSGIPVPELPRVVGRAGSSPAKLIDEFNWVARTQSCIPPSVDELEKWWRWAQ
jgi:hypothetical protein